MTAKTLIEEGFNNVSLVEQHSSLGGVWAAGRTYPLLSSNSPRGHYSLTDHPLHDTSKPGQWLFAEEIREGLVDYAQQHGIAPRISFRTRVVMVQEIGVDGQSGTDGTGVFRSSGWWIYTKNASQAEIDEAQPLAKYLVPEHLKPKPDLSTCEKRHADVLIVCSGLFSRPIVPKVENMDSFCGLAVHSSDIPKSNNVEKILKAQREGKHIVILGMGKSASDLADWAGQQREKLVKEGKNVPPVTILFRRPHWFLPLPFFTTQDYMRRSAEIGPWWRKTWKPAATIKGKDKGEDGAAKQRRRSQTENMEKAAAKEGAPKAEEVKKKKVPIEEAIRLEFGLPKPHPLLPEWSYFKDSVNGSASQRFFEMVQLGHVVPIRGEIKRLVSTAGSSEDQLEIFDIMSKETYNIPLSVFLVATGFSFSFPFLPEHVQRAVFPPGGDGAPELFRTLIPPTYYDKGNLVFNGIFNSMTCASSCEHAAHWVTEYLATRGHMAGLDRKVWTNEKMAEWCRNFSKIVNGRGQYGSGIKEGKINSFSRYIDFSDDLLGG